MILNCPSQGYVFGKNVRGKKNEKGKKKINKFRKQKKVKKNEWISPNPKLIYKDIKIEREIKARVSLATLGTNFSFVYGIPLF